MTHTVRLPKGWAETTLGEIRIDLSKGIDPRKEPDEIFELYSIPSHAEGRPEVVKGKEIGSAKKTLVPGAVVVSKINPRINRTWVVGSHTPHPKIGSGEWIPFFPVAGIVPEYLAHYMRQSDFRDYLSTRVSGVGGSLMRVKPSTLAGYPFVFPSEAHQHRIVEAIESYLTRLDDAVASLERVKRNLERYRASVLKAAVEGRLVPTEAELARREGRSYEPASELLKRILAERKTRWIEDAVEKARSKADGNADALLQALRKAEKKYKEPTPPDLSALRAQAGTTGLPSLPEGWCWTTAEQLMWSSEYGTSQKCAYGEEGPAVLRIPNIVGGAVDLEDIKNAVNANKLKPDGQLCRGDFLFIRTNGSKNLIGRGALVRSQFDEPTYFASYLIRFRLVDVSPVSEWFAAAWGSDFVRKQILKDAASSAGQHNVSMSAASAYLIPLPPCGEQSRILSELERCWTIAADSNQSAALAGAKGKALRQSILKWAFEGKLVEQDPEDEPASALLDRIRSDSSGAKK